MKTKIALTILLATPIHYLEIYIFSDWAFVIFMLVLVGIDVLCATLKLWKNKSISSTDFGLILLNCIIYAMVLVVAHVLTNVAIHGEKIIIFKWIDYVVYSGILVHVSISIFEKITYLKPGFFSSAILKRLKQFDAEGKKLMPQETQQQS